MTKDEQETILRWDAEANVVSIFTAYPPTMRKLTRAGYQPYRVNMRGGRQDGWFFRVPVGELRWRVGARSPARRRLSEPEREARRERLARARLARQPAKRLQANDGPAHRAAPAAV
jgi:hypothetical protein